MEIADGEDCAGRQSDDLPGKDIVERFDSARRALDVFDQRHRIGGMHDRRNAGRRQRNEHHRPDTHNWNLPRLRSRANSDTCRWPVWISAGASN